MDKMVEMILSGEILTALSPAHRCAIKKEMDLKHSWVKHHQRSVELAFERIAKLKHKLAGAREVVEYYSGKDHWGIINSLGKFSTINAGYIAKQWLEDNPKEGEEHDSGANPSNS